MSRLVVAEGICKRYSRNANAHLSYGVTDLLAEVFGTGRRKRLREDEFFAVRDLSFELHSGEGLGLVGRNGSGKTTVLRLLNGITKLDGGRVRIDGRVQALINLNAGFTPSLSGIDNIRNSAALMGLSRRETREVVDRAVDFAELDEFIDSPVQTYSAGMRARLGFAVAVHLDPDVLLIDEILAVGDYAFQNKCLTKLQELKKRGVGLILVTHNHTSVVQLCERALWLHQGKKMSMGPAKETVQRYLEFLEEQELERARRSTPVPAAPPSRGEAPRAAAPSEAREAGKAEEPREDAPREASEGLEGAKHEGLYHAMYPLSDRLADLEVSFLADGRESDVVYLHDEVEIQYSFRVLEPVEDLNVTLVFYRRDGLQLSAISTLNGDLLQHVREGPVRCAVRIPDLNLSPGEYVLVMPIHEGKSYLYRDVVKRFFVRSAGRLAWAVLDFRYEYKVYT